MRWATPRPGQHADPDALNNLPIYKTGLEVILAYIAANDNDQAKPDIWVARDIDLVAHKELTPVLYCHLGWRH
jgi:hypothetical protein